MKRIFIIIITLLSSYNTHSIHIKENNPQLTSVGYNNCDMKRNGEQLVIEQLIQKNSIIFDVGGGVGEWSAIVLQKKSPKCLYTFEPIPHTFKRLQNNIKTKPNVYLNNLACSNKQEEKTIHFHQNYPFLSSFHNRPAVDRLNTNTKEVTVQTTTVDLFCEQNNIEYIDFLKVDTEGEELAVLQGARAMLASNLIDIVQFEYGGTYPDAKITLKQVYNFLTKYGYQLYRVTPTYLIHVPEWKDSLETNLYSNYVALSPTSIERLQS